jgi:hypothetical protein
VLREKPVTLRLCSAEIPHEKGEEDVEFLVQLNTCCLLKNDCTQWSELLKLLENFKTYA